MTSVSVTKEAGCAQSAFYQHFAHVKECLIAATEQVTTKIRAAVTVARQKMYEKDNQSDEDLIRFFGEMIQMALDHRAVMQLFLRHRSNPLALNGLMYRFSRDLVLDLAKQMSDHLDHRSLPIPPGEQVEAVAEQVMGATFASLEAILEGRGLGIEETARTLAILTSAGATAVYHAIQNNGN